MTAMCLSSAPTAWRDRCARVALLLISAGSLALGGAAIAQEEPPITAVYKAQELSFHFRSSNSFYSCPELQRRVAHILLAIGARDDIDVKASNCEGYLLSEGTTSSRDRDPVFGDDGMNDRDRWGASARLGQRNDDRGQTAHVRVRLMMPVELTPKVLEEIDKDRSRRELVSRVTGNMAAAFNDPVVFAARRQEVTLSNRTVRLQPEDCPLLEQMTTSVFRKLNVRVVRRSFSCGGPRNEPSRIAPQLTVAALLPTGALLPMPSSEKKAGSGAPEASEPKAPEPPAETPPQ
jgi:hypothetical protein